MTLLRRHLQRLSTSSTPDTSACSTTSSSSKRAKQKKSNTSRQPHHDVNINQTSPTPPTSPTLRSFPSPVSHFSGHEDDEVSSISRPSLYSHEPQPRPAPFEQYYGDHMSQVHLLEELKSNRLEGVYNLSFMVLAFALFYLFVRNVVDNGFLAGPPAICFSILLRDSKMLFYFILPLPFFFVIPYLLILLLSTDSISSSTALIIHSLTLASLFLSSIPIIFYMELNPLCGVVAGCVVMILFLKMHSYVMTNLILQEETDQIRESRRKSKTSSTSNIPDIMDGRDHQNYSNLRRRYTTPVKRPHPSNLKTASSSALESICENDLTGIEESTEADSDSNGSPKSVQNSDDAKEKIDRTTTRRPSKREAGQHKEGKGCSSPGVKYPHNVTIENISYFVVAPTLVYETGYPRTSSIRPKYVAWQMLQMGICFLVMFVLLMQFCVPIWRTSAPTDRLWWFSIKLALPCFFMWLLMFWSLFHCALNAIAEVTRFADRQFYLDWWNATDLNQFWRLWNMPVHEWCIRHLYLETVSRQKLNRQAAALGTFLLSAVFHEYVCIVAFRMVRPYMFAGMIMQVPLVKWSTRFQGTRTGNYFMWIMLFLGQSWVPLLYCRDYLSFYDTLMCRPLYSRQ